MFWIKKGAPFEQVARSVLELKKLKSRETQLASKRQIERLIKNFGRFNIDEIRESDWVDYVDRERKKKPRTFYDDRKYMRMILLYAMREGLIKNRIALPIPDLPWNAGRELSQCELRRLENSAGRKLRFQIQIAWKMGLRLREMLRLRWDQVDLGDGIIHFSSGDTKTRKPRKVPIPPDLLPRFRARMRRSASRFVFPGRTMDRPQEYNQRAWRRLKLKTGIKARWHDLRHTCATQLLRKGVPPHIVRRYLGMSELVLNRVYAHVQVEDLRTAALAMSKR